MGFPLSGTLEAVLRPATHPQWRSFGGCCKLKTPNPINRLTKDFLLEFVGQIVVHHGSHS